MTKTETRRETDAGWCDEAKLFAEEVADTFLFPDSRDGRDCIGHALAANELIHNEIGGWAGLEEAEINQGFVLSINEPCEDEARERILHASNWLCISLGHTSLLFEIDSYYGESSAKGGNHPLNLTNSKGFANSGVIYAQRPKGHKAWRAGVAEELRTPTRKIISCFSRLVIMDEQTGLLALGELQEKKANIDKTVLPILMLDRTAY